MSSNLELFKICRIYEKNKLQDSCLGTELPIEIVSNLNPTKKGIREFSRVMSNYSVEEQYSVYLARFLTALMQVSRAKKFIIEPDAILDFIGFRLLGKEVVINGDVGKSAFMYARNCIVKINGDYGKRLGYIADNCSFLVKSLESNLGDLSKDCEIICLPDSFRRNLLLR